jgi:hypothetical protein
MMYGDSWVLGELGQLADGLQQKRFERKVTRKNEGKVVVVVVYISRHSRSLHIVRIKKGNKENEINNS